MTDRVVAGERDVSRNLQALARDTMVSAERRVAAIFHSFDVDRRVMEAQTKLSAADLRLLWLLSDGRARTQRDISDELSLEQSTVNRQVNAALRAGHLERQVSASGPARLVATGAGRRRFEADVEALMQLQAAALEALGDDAEQFLISLATFVEAYRDAAGGRSGR